MRWSSGAKVSQPRRLAPGEEDALLLAISTQFRTGPFQVGVRIQGSSGRGPVEQIAWVKMHVVPAAVMQPTHIRLERLRPGEKRTLNVRLWGVPRALENARAEADHSSVRVVRLRWSKTSNRAAVPEELQAVKELLQGDLVLEVDTDSADPEVTARVKLKAEVPERVLLPELSLYLRVRRPWRAYPPRVYVSAREPFPQMHAVLVRFEHPVDAARIAVGAPAGIAARVESLDEFTLRLQLQVHRPLAQPAVVRLEAKEGARWTVPLALLPDR